MSFSQLSRNGAFRMRRLVIGGGLCAAAVLVSITAGVAQPAPVTTMSGVYTAAQAAEGKALYDGACAMCHGPNLMGSFEAPPLTGQLVYNWAGESVGGLHSYVQKAMPLFAPGSLSAENNAKLVAYILQTNGYPAGNSPLPADGTALAKIRLAPLTPAQLIATNKTGASK